MIFRVLKIANRVAYWAYVAQAKVRQLPNVVEDIRPRFLLDETLAAPDGERFAIAVKYSKNGLLDGFLDLLDALQRQNVNVVVVCNGRPSEQDLDALRSRTHRLLVRKNIGRDFGAYRAATLHLAAGGVNPSRVLYFNDSLVYLPGPQLDQMIGAFIQSSYDLAGAFENHEHEHHVGSFAFSISGRVFADPAVLRFWRRYKSYDLRPHAIHRGEIGLSRVVKSRGYAVDVIYSVDRLLEALSRLSLAELLSLVRYLPSNAAAQPFSEWIQEPLDASRLLTLLRDQVAYRASGKTPTISDFRNQKGVRDVRARLAGEFEQDQLMREWLIDRLLGTFMNSSQVHFGFGLFHTVLYSPVLKKDLLAHGVFLEHQCARILETQAPEHRSRIIRELVNRGRPVRPSLMRRFKLENGLI
ncbi:MAG: rhamnan synthesis F family protein [Xanthobacteraceae bacterium]|nr:rhamnan synthesis F family protein [Xanthobacteraceae bacterium]